MCGIAGVFGQQQERLGNMLAVMQSRGPDATRQQSFPENGGTLGHVRLSILDLDPRSHQPFVSPCGRYWLCFNGEIYNYLELRDELEQRGAKFHTSSDTEVLLHWLIAHGVDGLERLEGMFALGLLDTKHDKLLLARDHIGEKPLYYSASSVAGEQNFAFASDLNALRLLSWVDTTTNMKAVGDYLRFLYSPHPNTLYQGIQELPPGSYVFREGKKRVTSPAKFYDLESCVSDAREMSYNEAVAEFHDEFVRSVKLRLQSDVPVGLFLSGGLDSNAILSATKELGVVDQLKAYTVAYDQQGGADGDESGLARESAAHFGIDHHVATFAAERPLLETVERTLALFGQPYGNATVLVADMISQAASHRSRVCLVGDGGDELLGGYPRHRVLPWLSRYSSLLRPFGSLLHGAATLTPSHGRWGVQADRLKRLTQNLNMPLSESFLRWTTHLAVEDIRAASGLACDSGFYEGLKETFERNQRRPLLAASLVDLQSFVPCKLMHCSDRAGMAHSLELRCPFLAPPLIHRALSFPDSHKLRGRRVKPILADAFQAQLPPIIKRQPKRPFNPPMRRYMRSHFEQLETLLRNRSSSICQLLGDRFLAERLGEFRNGRRDYSTLLWGLLVLGQWLDGQSTTARTITTAA